MKSAAADAAAAATQWAAKGRFIVVLLRQPTKLRGIMAGPRPEEQSSSQKLGPQRKGPEGESAFGVSGRVLYPYLVSSIDALCLACSRHLTFKNYE